VYRGPPEVYRGPCMKITPWNSYITYTMAVYRRVYDLRSPAGWLPVHRDQLRAQRSV